MPRANTKLPQARSCKFDHKAAIVQIMDDGDPQGVLARLPENLRPMAQYALIRNIRTRISRQSQYVNKSAYSQLAEWGANTNYSEKDRNRLRELLTKPGHTIHWLQSKKFLWDSFELQEKFRNLRVFWDPFYDFKAPESLKRLLSEDTKKRHAEQHQHKSKRPTEDYHFTEQEIDDMIATSVNLINSDLDWKVGANSMRLLEALCLLTGRRKWELCATMRMRSSPDSDYQAEVRGLSKTVAGILGEDEWHYIPLLAPIAVITRGISNLRRYEHTPGKYSAGKALFPKMRHTAFRDIYARRTYRDRHLNKFMPESCSENYWKSKALRIEFTTAMMHYSTMVIDRDEPKCVEPEQPLGEEMADSHDRPQEHSLENPL